MSKTPQSFSLSDLSQQDLGLIVSALGELKASVSRNLLNRVERQVTAQLVPPEPPAAPPPPEGES